MTELRKLFEVARDMAAKMFNEGKEHEVHPMWHAVTGDDENMIIATPWTSNEDKDATVHGLRKLFAEHKVKRFAFICEAWVLEVRLDMPRPHAPPSEHEDRREVLRIIAEDNKGGQLSGQFYILRPEHGPPKLSPFEEHDDAVGIAGRMTHMLQRVRS